MDELVFETDRDGTIRAISENSWNSFAKENGAPELSADAVTGRNLFDFIQGEQVRAQIRQVLERISHDPNWVWVLPFRCDSPDRHRNFCQSLRPVFEGDICTGFIFHSFYQCSWQRPPMRLYDFKRLRRLAEENRDLPNMAVFAMLDPESAENTTPPLTAASDKRPGTLVNSRSMASIHREAGSEQDIAHQDEHKERRQGETRHGVDRVASLHILQQF